jgi:ATP-dependent DNA ligase
MAEALSKIGVVDGGSMTELEYKKRRRALKKKLAQNEEIEVAEVNAIHKESVKRLQRASLPHCAGGPECDHVRRD